MIVAPLLSLGVVCAFAGGRRFGSMERSCVTILYHVSLSRGRIVLMRTCVRGRTQFQPKWGMALAGAYYGGVGRQKQ